MRATFNLESFFPPALLDELTELRIHSPEVIEEEAGQRTRRKELTRDGKLFHIDFGHFLGNFKSKLGYVMVAMVYLVRSLPALPSDRLVQWPNATR